MQQTDGRLCSNYFYPRPPRGGRPAPKGIWAFENNYFYPRPPRGGRLCWCGTTAYRPRISIHALREEGDGCPEWCISTRRYFYPRPPRGGRRQHNFRVAVPRMDFYPRPPRGGRPHKITNSILIQRYFYPRPPRGGRQLEQGTAAVQQRFLSTPSARRATPYRVRIPIQSMIISIHALREEGDPRSTCFHFRDLVISIHALREEGDECIAG